LTTLIICFLIVIISAISSIEDSYVRMDLRSPFIDILNKIAVEEEERGTVDVPSYYEDSSSCDLFFLLFRG